MASRSRKPVAVLIALIWLWTALSMGCGADSAANDPDTDDSSDEFMTLAEEELAAFIEERLDLQMPPPLTPAERELYEIKLERQQVAREIGQETHQRLAPIGAVVAIFAIDGPADVLLTVLPVHKIVKARKIAKVVFGNGRKKRGAEKLADLKAQFVAALDREASDMLRLAQNLDLPELRALKVIHAHTGSTRVSQMLLRKRVKHSDVDLVWLARLLDKNKLDRDTVRRFTFDADFVAEYTEYSANPSWKVLQRMVQGEVVDEGQRSSLTSKLAGLMGEHAAGRRVAAEDFGKKYQLGRGSGPFDVRRGAVYARDECLDIVAFGSFDKMLFAEVKNWSAKTWNDSSKLKQLSEQLKRHNDAIERIEREEGLRRNVGQVLMVASGGYQAMSPAARDRLRAIVKKRGWTIEQFPSDDVKTVGSLIDDLRR